MSISYPSLAEDLDHLSIGTGPKHAIAMHGLPKYPANFRQFPFIDPYGEKGGTLSLGVMGGFDSLNPFIIKGASPGILLDIMRQNTVESLMVRSPDEPFTLYGLIAETIETPEDRSWVEFTIHPRAEFSDGTPITADDVIFSMETLRDKGRPNHRRYYSLVEEAISEAPNKVRFVFSAEGNAELPLIMGLMPILSKDFWSLREFDQTTIEPPLGSGAYIITDVDLGRSITFERNLDYWGSDLSVNQGMHNFDYIRYEFFRDNAAMFEAFKASELTLRVEDNVKKWVTQYDFLATRNGQIQMAEIPHGKPADMYGFVMNTRQEILQDARVRDALIMLFDFDWMNENFFHGKYRRVQSYFDNSELGTVGLKADGDERDMLGKHKKAVRRDILERGWVAPRGGSPALMRENKRLAMKLFEQAGWQIQDGKMTNVATGQPFTFEIVLRESEEEKVALTYAKTLEELGIEAKVSLVEPIQFQLRRETYDFDMIPFTWRGTLSPGNEQAFRFGSNEADMDGTFNLAGVKSEAVDHLIEEITNARSREDLVAASRALDRVLLSGSYIIPFWYSPVDRVAYWAEVNVPERKPLVGMHVESWWMLPDN